MIDGGGEGMEIGDLVRMSTNARERRCGHGMTWHGVEIQHGVRCRARPGRMGPATAGASRVAGVEETWMSGALLSGRSRLKRALSLVLYLFNNYDTNVSLHNLPFPFPLFPSPLFPFPLSFPLPHNSAAVSAW